MPGVLQIEAMAQVGGIFALSQVEDDGDYDTYFLKIQGALQGNGCSWRYAYYSVYPDVTHSKRSCRDAWFRICWIKACRGSRAYG